MPMDNISLIITVYFIDFYKVTFYKNKTSESCDFHYSLSDKKLIFAIETISC